MKKHIFFILSITLMASLMTACQSTTGKMNETDQIRIAVSIIPQETFVKAVAGEYVDIVTMIPPGASPANYQPTPRQMTALSRSELYLSIGVPAETANILPNLKDLNPDIRIVDLASRVGKVFPDRVFNREHDEHSHEKEHDGHTHEGRDPHIWMSPQRVIVMVQTIRDELMALDPKNRNVYEQNAEEYIRELEEMDREIRDSMENLEHKAFIITHPSIGYFADDYGLEMISIEQDGKEATAAHFQEVIDFARKNQIHIVFYQAEFDNRQAKALSREIAGEVMEIEPLAADYIGNIKKINATFRSVLKGEDNANLIGEEPSGEL